MISFIPKKENWTHSPNTQTPNTYISRGTTGEREKQQRKNDAGIRITCK
jgi:hypothetical protein